MFGTQKEEEIDSLAHTRWNCKYHIVFAPKYRRQAIYEQIRTDIGSILRKLCEYKGVEIIEAETCPDPNPDLKEPSVARKRGRQREYAEWKAK